MPEELFSYNPKLYIQFNLINLLFEAGVKLGVVQKIACFKQGITEDEIKKEKSEFFEALVKIFNIIGTKLEYRKNKDDSLKYPSLAKFDAYVWGDKDASELTLKDLKHYYRDMRFFCEDLGFTKTEGLRETSKITRLIKGGLIS